MPLKKLILLLIATFAFFVNAQTTTLPFTVTFEEDNPLQGWIYNDDFWSIVTEGDGNAYLKGMGGEDKPLIVSGINDPEWAQRAGEALLIQFDFNLQTGNAGLRMVFRYVELTGYNVLELFPGRISVKRDDLIGERNYISEVAHENRLTRGDALVNIRENTWHHVLLWIDGSSINVYLDRKLVMRSEDSYTPRLDAGAIIFLATEAGRESRIDNLNIRRVLPASTHFDDDQLPITWRSTTTNEVVGRDEDGNRFAQLDNEMSLMPNMEPSKDLRLNCRLRNEIGGFDLHLLESDAGELRLSFALGSLVIERLDAEQNTVWLRTVPNFYNRGRWDDFTVRVMDNQLELYREGILRFDEAIGGEVPLEAGTIRFSTENGERQRIDDCLILDTPTYEG